MSIKVGASSIDITPRTSQFLCGYPHVERYSTGVDTELRSSALYITDGETRLLTISNDLIYLDKEVVAAIRGSIAAATRIPTTNIMLTCTHTHSGPLMVNSIVRTYDSAIPERDNEYLKFVIERISTCAIEAVSNPLEATIGLGTASSAQVGCNRRYPSGASNPLVPVLVAKNAASGNLMAIMTIVCVHPTVLH
ncbi:MAG: neutral/alkaline non-lysosomal ceramidase N-terminal domain-containing protein, partial [Victivallales bacterium]|nr:neutral/alkaline non-lysosomal ceramidase N-terminal domain-containing protein [Victivallales bacterium]